MHAIPILPVDDLAAAEAFHAALGLDVERYDATYAWCSAGAHEVWHLSVVEGLDTGRNPTAVFVHVDDVDAVQRRLAAAGAVDGEAVDQPWGMRELVVVDPAGNRIRLGQRAQ